MYKHILHKSFSVMLALLVMLSTVSFTIEKHYCKGALVDISVFTSAKKCKMDSCASLQKKSCCEDEIHVVQGQDKLHTVVALDLELKKQQFMSSVYPYYYNYYKSLSKCITFYKDYSPPNLVQNIQMLNQTFLI